MNVGIYIGQHTPEAGGAYTLVDKIISQIIELNDKSHTYFFLVNSEITQEIYIENNFNFVNIDFYFSKKKSSFVFKAIRKLKNYTEKFLCIKLNTTQKTFDTLFSKYNIDFLWLTSPIYIETTVPYIATIWDLGHRTVPYFPEVNYTGWKWDSRDDLYNKIIPKASYILTGNETGKKEIIQHYPVNPEKIKVIPFPLSNFCMAEHKKITMKVPEVFFMYPAQFWPHKNHIVILHALKILKEQNIVVNIVFTGSNKGNLEHIKQQTKNLDLETQVYFLGFVSDDELYYLYTHAQAMIFASLMGPNNMPPIEAVCMDCPVIISGIEGHKEQLRDAAIYFEPTNEHDLAQKIKDFLENSLLRKNLLEKSASLKTEFLSVNYFTEVKKIIGEFALIRRTWGKAFVHL